MKLIQPIKNKKKNKKKSKKTDLKLMSKLNFGSFTLSNRVAMAPMTRGRATEQFIPTDIMATYYAQRADAGLLITEGTGISRQGLGWYRAPGIWNEKQIAQWTKIVNKVHAKNGKIALQLWHMGRQAHSDVTGEPIVSASAIALKGDVTTNKGVKKPYETPKSLTQKEIDSVLTDYANAAENAIKKCGFDAVEIHGANGYLVDQFLQSCSNKRDDIYGGSLENRLLFMKQVVNKIIDRGINRNKVGIRLSPNGAFGGMGSEDNVDLFNKAIEWLSAQNILYIHLMDGLSFGFHKKCEPYTLKMAKDIINNNKSNTLLMGNVGYTKESAEEVINKGDADLIAFGRPYIANSDLVYRFKNNIDLEKEAEYKYWWGWNLNEEGYIDWPTAKL